MFVLTGISPPGWVGGRPQAAILAVATGFAGDAETVAGCLTTAPLPNCDESTLITDTVTNTTGASLFLWADPTHLGSTAQTAIGNQANVRAHSNPF